MKKNLLPSIVLGCICLVVALLLSVVNMVTAPIIAERQNAAANEALLEVLPNGKNFKEIELTADYPAIVVKGWTAEGGSVFQMEVIGYASGLVIMCGVDADGKIAGVKHISSNETFGAEGELNDAYTAKGDTIDSLGMILSASASKGAPMTSQAYYDAIKAALQSALIAGGAEVDTRTPEQILQDDLNAALGTTGLTFTKWFATEAVEGIDKVYESEAGRVYVIGESYVAIKANGELVAGSASEADIAKATTADAIISASVLTEITELPENASSNVQKAYATASGNYVFEIKASGYKNATNKQFAGMDIGHFFIKVAISSDGKIIDVITTSHEESKGYGDACATEEYYEQYRGAGSSDVILSVEAPDLHKDQIADGTTGVGVIASSTFTTWGYQNAVKTAFEAFELLTADEGGND